MASDFDLVAAASANHHLVTPTIVVSCGISRRRWQRWQDTGLWVQVTPTHFRHAATPLTFEMQVRAGSEWLGGRGALFGTTALAWLGVEVPQPQWAEFLVTRADRSIPNWMIVHTSSYWTPRNASTIGAFAPRQRPAPSSTSRHSCPRPATSKQRSMGQFEPVERP